MKIWKASVIDSLTSLACSPPFFIKLHRDDNNAAAAAVDDDGESHPHRHRHHQERLSLCIYLHGALKWGESEAHKIMVFGISVMHRVTRHFRSSVRLIPTGWLHPTMSDGNGFRIRNGLYYEQTIACALQGSWSDHVAHLRECSKI